jgi:hypothetical protein
VTFSREVMVGWWLEAGVQSARTLLDDGLFHEALAWEGLRF